MKNSMDTKHSRIWNDLGTFTFEHNVKWRKIKSVLKEFNVQHNMDATSWEHAGGFAVSMLAELVVENKITLQLLKNKLL